MSDARTAAGRTFADRLMHDVDWYVPTLPKDRHVVEQEINDAILAIEAEAAQPAPPARCGYGCNREPEHEGAHHCYWRMIERSDRTALPGLPADDIDLATWTPPRPDFSRPASPGNEAWRREDIQALAPPSVSSEADTPGLDVTRLARALRAIHGDVIPLPNHCSPQEYAAIIADWYESGSDGPGLRGPHLRAYLAAIEKQP